jgi:glycolate oxidase iron-sulfur subunit
MTNDGRMTQQAPSTNDDAQAARPGAAIDYELFLDCVHCGLCTAACPTYLETGNENDSPRGRIYLMRAVRDDRLHLSREVRRHLELCLDCRACESACPSGVQYGRLIEPFRIEMERVATDAQPGAAGKAKTRDWFHRWILYGLFPYPRRTRLALAPARLLQRSRLDRLLEWSGLLRLLPRRLQQLHAMLPPPRQGDPRLPEFLPAQGKRRARVALFTGCVGDVFFRHTNWATARVLQVNGCDVVVPSEQQCCGAIHFHSGSEAPAAQFARANRAAFAADDVDAIVVNVAGCGSMLKDYAHAFDGADGPSADLSGFAQKVRDISEFLVELGPVPPEGEIAVKATYHDACHLAHAQQIRQPPRQLLEMIPALELVPLEESEVCCGAAGTYNLTEPEMSARLSARKMEMIRATGAEAVFTANAGCLLQIEKQARQERLPLWVAHPIDVLDLSYRRQPPPAR